jgi:hypothetical protein
MAMGRRAFIASVVVVSLLFGMQAVELAKANPYMREYVEDGTIPLPEGHSSPEIEIFTPTNATAYNSNTVALSFNVTCLPSVNLTLSLSDLYYKTSWQTETTHIDFWSIIRENNYATPKTFSFKINLTGLHDGPRWLDIFAVAKAFAYESYHTLLGITYTQHYISYKSTASAHVNFTIDTRAPEISILSEENKTYNGDTGAPIEFHVNEPTSWAAYSLDEQANVTITGNTTLTQLNDGLHKIAIYANDTAGNTGRSNSFSFTTKVIHTTPNPSLLPSPSPTSTLTPSKSPAQSPAIKPSPTPISREDSFAPLATAIGLVVAVVIVGLVVFFARRRGWK